VVLDRGYGKGVEGVRDLTVDGFASITYNIVIEKKNNSSALYTLRDRISEEGKVRLMVIPIVAMLAVTMVVAGWQYEEQVEIDTEENPGELTIEHHMEGYQNKSKNFENVSASATTTVNNESTLNLNIEPISIRVDSFWQSIKIDLSAEGSFEEDLDVEAFKFRAGETEENEEPFNDLHFKSARSQIDEGELWPSEKRRSGVITVSPDHYAYEAFDVHSNEFDVEAQLDWDMPPENMGEEFTLKLEAVVAGLSEEVSSTVYLHIERGDEERNLK